MGFICLACDLVATALVKERIPRKRKQHKKLSDIIKFEVLKDVNFGIWCAGAALQLMAYFQPFFFLPCKGLALSCSIGISGLTRGKNSLRHVDRIIRFSGFLFGRCRVGHEFPWSNFMRVCRSDKISVR